MLTNPAGHNTIPATQNQSQGSPSTAHGERSYGYSSSMIVQPDFDMNGLLFDDFYPMNWNVENAVADITNLIPASDPMTG
jgi:hypothetical protein